MIDRRILTCYNCGAWDDEREGCTMPAPDMQYACPLKRDGENKEKDEELIRKTDVLDMLNTMWGKTHYICPTCGSYASKIGNLPYRYCRYCGQKMREG